MFVKIGKYPKNTNKKRKIKVKIHGFDTYNLDHALALIIVSALKKLKELKHGAPFVDNEDVPEELHSSGDVWNDDENWFKRWDYVLDQMIWAFSELMRDWESDYYSGKSKFQFIPVDEVGNKVDKKDAVYFEHKISDKDTFKVDEEGLEKHRDKINNGLRLFAKYYSALWT
jgi:hypothetical protein